jgi:hypothetical protein
VGGSIERPRRLATESNGRVQTKPTTLFLGNDLEYRRVIIRRLPPTMSRSDFVQWMEPWKDTCDRFDQILQFHEGKQQQHPKISQLGFAYVYMTPNNAIKLRQALSNHPFSDAQGRQYIAIVEYALLQTKPLPSIYRETQPSDSFEASPIFRDPEYQHFIKSLETGSWNEFKGIELDKKKRSEIEKCFKDMELLFKSSSGPRKKPGTSNQQGSRNNKNTETKQSTPSSTLTVSRKGINPSPGQSSLKAESTPRKNPKSTRQPADQRNAPQPAKANTKNSKPKDPKRTESIKIQNPVNATSMDLAKRAQELADQARLGRLKRHS